MDFTVQKCGGRAGEPWDRRREGAALLLKPNAL